jgi:DNA-directed RNA polymerase subunit RPC12/RpoP
MRCGKLYNSNDTRSIHCVECSKLYSNHLFCAIPKDTKLYAYFECRAREEIMKLLGNKCSDCGRDCGGRLHIHHLNKEEAYGDRDFEGGYYQLILAKIEDGSKDYEILCSRCHHKRHAEMRKKWLSQRMP